MTKPTLLFMSIGELATHLLEMISRTDIFGAIIVASRDIVKARMKANNAALGAGIEGQFTKIYAEELDVGDPCFPAKLNQIQPDFIFSAPSLLPWWRTDTRGVDVPFAGLTSLHLCLMEKFRNQIARSNVNSIWIGAAFPDVINAVLNRTGFGPNFGIGNVQEPVVKIQMGVGQILGCNPRDIQVKLVAQHAFEYFVLNSSVPTELPPYLLKATLGNKDVTGIANKALRQPFPFSYDVHFNRVSASAGLVSLRALTEDKTSPIHLPGIGPLVGGYPVLVSNSGVRINIPSEWSMEDAISVNEKSLQWDGISEITSDGTIIFTDKTRDALYHLCGKFFDSLSVDTAKVQAKTLLQVLS